MKLGSGIKLLSGLAALLLLLSAVPGVAEPDETAAAQDAVRGDILPSADGETPEYTLMAQDGGLSLYADRTTEDFFGTFKVVSAATGYTWYSNPPAADEDEVAKGKTKMELFSNLVVSYADPEVKRMDTIPSRTGSVNKNGASMRLVENGFEVIYDFPEDGFTVPLRVELTDGDLRVSINFAAVREYGANRIYHIRLLPYFGAVNGDEEGYAFVPEGSGALMDFGNGKTSYKSYSERVYGQDINIQIQQQQERRQAIRLPVFGLKTANDAFAAIIEEGDALASIEAAVAGKGTGYNMAAAGFQVRSTDTYRFGDTASSLSQSAVVYADGPIDNRRVAVRYVFLSGEEATYAGMAGAYRRYLQKNGVLGDPVDGELPFYMELLGGVVKETTFLGFPTSAVTPMTTFAQAQELIGRLDAQSVGGITVKYTNWSKDLLWQRIADDAAADGKLGGSGGLKKLLAAAEDLGAQVFLDTDYTAVARFSGLSNAYNSAAKTISDTAATTGVYKIDTFYRDKNLPTQYLLSLGKMKTAAAKYRADYSKRYANPYISLGRLGNVLYADYTDIADNRQTAAAAQAEVAAGFREDGSAVMVSGGNAYMLGAASHILDMPQAGGYDLFDRSVPFYQIVLHGYVHYAAGAFNLSEDVRIDFLRAVETGASPHYTWYAGEAKELVGTAYAGLYSGSADYWMETAAGQYAELSALNEKVGGCAILRHECLADGVYAVTYDNGVTVVVNYGSEAVQTAYGAVDGLGYRIAEGGK